MTYSEKIMLLIGLGGGLIVGWVFGKFDETCRPALKRHDRPSRR